MTEHRLKKKTDNSSYKSYLGKKPKLRLSFQNKSVIICELKRSDYISSFSLFSFLRSFFFSIRVIMCLHCNRTVAKIASALSLGLNILSTCPYGM